jgi:hypothetical protein
MDFTLDRNELKALYEITLDALETTKERIVNADQFGGSLSVFENLSAEFSVRTTLARKLHDAFSNMCNAEREEIGLRPVSELYEDGDEAQE